MTCPWSSHLLKRACCCADVCLTCLACCWTQELNVFSLYCRVQYPETLTRVRCLLNHSRQLRPAQPVPRIIYTSLKITPYSTLWNPWKTCKHSLHKCLHSCNFHFIFVLYIYDLHQSFHYGMLINFTQKKKSRGIVIIAASVVVVHVQKL